MRPRSLRARLAIWQAALLALTLLSLAGLTYALLLRMLQSRADAGLREYADNVARSIAASLYQSSVGRRDAPPFLADDVRSWGRYVQVVDDRRNILARSDALASHPLPISTRSLLNGLAGRATFETISGLGEHPVRVVTVPVVAGEQIPYLVMAGLSLEGVEATLERAAQILMVLTPAVFVMALVGGWLLVGRALRPVEELTQTALELESRNLRRRIVPPVSDDEIGRLAGAFDQMLARLDRSFRQVQQFSADASHELKTPLTTIRGEAEVALMGERSPAEQRQALQTILEGAERMSAIVDNLLLIARADSESSQVARISVALEQVALEAYEALAPIARAQSVEIEIGPLDEAAVLGDRLWLLQLTTNLLNNAVKYSAAGSRVLLSLTASDPEPAYPDGAAVLVVRDSGIGIAAEHLPHIFDRFYRVDPGRSRNSGGTGLGLSIAQWVAASHGGKIDVDSEPGRFTEFRVTLPLAPPSSSESTDPEEAPTADDAVA